MTIKNIIFDIGNVLVKWAPREVVAKLFPAEDHDQLTLDLFTSQSWLDLNLGKISESQLIQIYHKTLHIDIGKLTELMAEIKESLTLLPGSLALVEKLYKKNYPLFVITDNTHEILAYLKKRYDFWWMFKFITSSAEVGILKPNEGIYRYLLGSQHLISEECLFLDDVLQNVEGARRVGIEAYQFTTAQDCERFLDRVSVL
jgi:putative hydrolase of the HAD superfamily